MSQWWVRVWKELNLSPNLLLSHLLFSLILILHLLQDFKTFRPLKFAGVEEPHPLLSSTWMIYNEVEEEWEWAVALRTGPVWAQFCIILLDPGFLLWCRECGSPVPEERDTLPCFGSLQAPRWDPSWGKWFLVREKRAFELVKQFLARDRLSQRPFAFRSWRALSTLHHCRSVLPEYGHSTPSLKRYRGRWGPHWGIEQVHLHLEWLIGNGRRVEKVKWLAC